MTSVVIAAHNEATVIGDCLDTLLADASPGELEVIVSANGCTDDTASVARARSGVTVIESPVAGKAAALNRADLVATRYPRVYLDADIMVPAETVRALRRALEGPGDPAVAVPSRNLDVAGRPLAVRCYFAVQQRLPVFDEGLFGRGLIAVSRAGRARFGEFPPVLADDLFLDSLFTATERVRVPETTTVATPLRTRDLVRRLARVRRGNAALRSSGAASAGMQSTGLQVRRANRTSWLQDVVLPRPWLVPAGAVYAALSLWAALMARRGGVNDMTWGRDESSRLSRPVEPIR